jgi:hypothetical protein
MASRSKDDDRRRRRRALLAKAREAASDLTNDEIASLRELNKGLMARRIPDDHACKLIERGLAEQKLGGLAITGLGKFAVM